MGRFGKYKMLLGEPCRLYTFNVNTKEYIYCGNGYYIGNGCCVNDLTDIRDRFLRDIEPVILHYDRYIPMRLWNKDYQYAKESGVLYKTQWVFKEILSPDYELNDFNTNNLIDYENVSLNEFWWWNRLRSMVYNESLTKNKFK